MEDNNIPCDINHLDADVLLPPRKRLLPGLKMQNFDVNSSPAPAYTCLGSLSKFHLSDPNHSNEEIFEASRQAAIEAERFAKAARAIAEVKAAKAVKAVAAAKIALELVATSSDEAASRDRYLKKNKMQKHVPVQMLSKNQKKGPNNCRTDEEIAQTLHRSINSSPRISKNSTSDSRNHKHKRFKSSCPPKRAKLQNGCTSNGNGMAREEDSDCPVWEKDLNRVDIDTSNTDRAGDTKMKNGEASQSSQADCINMETGKGVITSAKEKFGKIQDDMCSVGRREGRLK